MFARNDMILFCTQCNLYLIKLINRSLIAIG